jgi:AcrR family transcriptional regulator
VYREGIDPVARTVRSEKPRPAAHGQVTSLRTAQKEMTRSLLLSKALELFALQGYAGTTVDDIAVAAGTSRVTFYAYFPSRTELMRALIDQLNELLARSESPVHGSTEEALVDAVRNGTRASIAAWLASSAGRWPIIRPYLNAAFEAAAIDLEIRILLDAWYDESIGDLQDGLEGAARFDPDTRRIRSMLAWAQLDYVARRWMKTGDDADQNRTLEVLTESWLHLLSTDDHLS